MSFQLNRSSKEPMSEINVTPFVDVMLVLLIIFMVTAPLLTVGVQVDLPESAADSLPDDQEPLTVTINSKISSGLQPNLALSTSHNISISSAPKQAINYTLKNQNNSKPSLPPAEILWDILIKKRWY